MVLKVSSDIYLSASKAAKLQALFFYKKNLKTRSLYKPYNSSPGHFQLLTTAQVISLTFCVRHMKRNNSSSGKQPL